MKYVPCHTNNLLNINSILSSASISQTHPRIPWCLVVAVSIFGHLKDTAVTLCPSRSKRFYWLFGTTFSKQKKHSKNHFLTHWECVMPAELTFARASALEMSLTYIALHWCVEREICQSICGWEELCSARQSWKKYGGHVKKKGHSRNWSFCWHFLAFTFFSSSVNGSGKAMEILTRREMLV